jgi:hypothetical protein
MHYFLETRLAYLNEMYLEKKKDLKNPQMYLIVDSQVKKFPIKLK